MKIDAINFTNIIINIADTIKDNLDYLTELDTEIGDGDHGINMAKGFKKIKEKLSETDILDIDKTLILSGKVLLNEIGGAMGPLYGGGLIKAGMALKGKNTIWIIKKLNKKHPNISSIICNFSPYLNLFVSYTHYNFYSHIPTCLF